MGKFNEMSVVAGSALAGGVPSSFSLKVGSAPVPSSAFQEALPGAVRLGMPVLSGTPGRVLVTVPWSDPVSGMRGAVKCLDSGFPVGEASRFLQALQSAAASGELVFLGGAPGGPRNQVLSGFFCAVSTSPFGSAPSAGSSLVFGG